MVAMKNEMDKPNNCFPLYIKVGMEGALEKERREGQQEKNVTSPNSHFWKILKDSENRKTVSSTLLSNEEHCKETVKKSYHI